jgi:hypothetical protein
MPVTWQVVAPGGVRFNNYRYPPSASDVFTFNPIPDRVTLTNTVGGTVTVWVDRYRGSTSQDYAGNVLKTTIAAGATLSIDWAQGDLQWIGIGINGEFLPQGLHELVMDWTAPANCAYGTRLKPLVEPAIYLTPEYITAVLQSRGLLFLSSVLSILAYTVIDANELCGKGPPQLPVIDLSTLSASIATATQIAKAIWWSELCECIPGTPSPIPYPPAQPVQPPGWPAPPTFSCVETDLCAAVVQIQKQLASLQQSVAQQLALVTLQQRYTLPFATISGARHAGLSGSGAFAVSRLIGMLVQVTQFPPVGRFLEGSPPYIWDVGWMSIIDVTGVLEEKRIVFEAQNWLPQHMPEATTFSFFLKEGVVADFVELQAEP